MAGQIFLLRSGGREVYPELRWRCHKSTLPIMPRKNIWLDQKGLDNLALIKKRWGCSEGEVVRRSLELAIVFTHPKKK